jgi:nucleotide-binding universal stress UspA family protein
MAVSGAKKTIDTAGQGPSEINNAWQTGLRSVLLATDFSEASTKPLHHALAIARHYHAKFYLAHVVSALGFTIAGAQAKGLAFEAAEREAHRLKEELIAGQALVGLEHEFIIREGDTWTELDAIIRQKSVDLVVIGTHGRGSLEKLLLGSVAEQIFRHADCPVLTVGPHSRAKSPLEDAREMRPFLFATDFSAHSLGALPHAISFADHFKAKLCFLHVAPVVPIPEGFHWSKTGDLPEMREDARRKALGRFEELAPRYAALSIPPEFQVEFGKPGERILHAAKTLKADAIIMGLHHSGHAEVASHMPWETAYQVVSAAACSVLTVRSRL